ncbi:MAG: L,D-transpeptidase [Candidatus Levybacteria bacterium]|nr:L,D-transpeptidase [Candidatus Levybacteria bacterium]
MKKVFSLTLLAILLGSIVLLIVNWQEVFMKEQATVKNDYWFVLHRQSQTEQLFQGIPGNQEKSQLIKTFVVKTGIHGERPTPLPQLLGREYWVITKKQPELSNPETAPYFITLNVPAPSEPPYGPSPYEECNGQCNWVRQGDFGLHGVAGIPERLTDADPGSSGCIRHTDKDITYLYNLLELDKGEIRYYIEDN